MTFAEGPTARHEAATICNPQDWYKDRLWRLDNDNDAPTTSRHATVGQLTHRTASNPVGLHAACGAKNPPYPIAAEAATICDPKDWWKDHVWRLTPRTTLPQQQRMPWWMSPPWNGLNSPGPARGVRRPRTRLLPLQPLLVFRSLQLLWQRLRGLHPYCRSPLRDRRLPSGCHRLSSDRRRPPGAPPDTPLHRPLETGRAPLRPATREVPLPPPSP